MKKNNLQTLALFLLVIGGSTLVCGEARADFLVSIGGAEQAVTDQSYDYLSEDGFLSDSHLKVQLPLGPVYLGLEYGWATEEFDPFNDIDTSLELDSLLVTSRFGHEFFDIVEPYVAIGLGFTYADLALSIRQLGRRDQDAWLFNGYAVGGVEAHLPGSLIRSLFGIARGSYAEDLTAGIYVEGGYRFTSTADFDKLERPEPDKEPDPENRQLPTSALSFGSVDLSGVMLRSGLVVRF